MAFAAALSTHPVSSHATGEVLGQLIETIGAGADLVILVATPGHGGALEDIADTARRVLEPGTFVAAVTVGVGVGEEWVERGPGLAAWAGHCGPLRAVAPGESWPAPTEAGAALVLTSGVMPAGLIELRRAGVPVLAGSVGGPVSVDAAPPGRGAAGAVFGARSGFDLAVARGLRGLGPALEVTRAERTMVYELDGRPALQQLIVLARDGLPVADLPVLADGLHLRPVGATLRRGRPDEPLGVVGMDRTNGAIAVTAPLVPGDLVQFAVPDPLAVRTSLARSFEVAPAGAIVLTTPKGGRYLGSHHPRPHDDVLAAAPNGAVPPEWVEPPSPLPAATLVCAVDPVSTAASGRAEPPVTTATVAYFPQGGFAR